MTRKKKNAIIAGIVIVGIVAVLFSIPTLFSSANMTAGGEATEVMFQSRLLEYAEFGLFFDDETNAFFYNEQRVRRLVDTPSLFQHDDGIVEITITRNSAGEIIEFHAKNAQKAVNMAFCVSFLL